MDSNWFLNRGLKALDYQVKAINKVQQSLLDRDITVLAASPSAGKTLMSIYIIEDYLKTHPGARVLVLAHGTTVLRSQFHDVLNQYKPDFTFDCATSCDEYHEFSKDKQVVVTLPQTIARCKSLNKIDLLVVDEAHEFYFAKTVENLIKKTKVKKQLLLTGTPSEFILKQYFIVPVALNTVYDANMISDFYVDIASSNYDFEFKDFNFDSELKKDVSFHKADTRKSLDELIKSIVVYLKSIRGNSYINLQPEWLPTLKQLKKTMIACKSQHQAKQVLDYFTKIGVNAALSISDTDKDSLEIQRFKDEEDVLVLIVVGRGILGFNYPELVNIVDMTMSYNIDRIYQLLCRIARKHPDGDKKLFFKIAPQMLTDYYQHIMTAVCMLTEEEYFLKYNGRNFKDMEVIIKKAYDKQRNSGENTVDNRSKKQKKYMPVDMDGLPVFEFFKSIYHKKGELLSVYARTTINDIRSEFMDNKPNGYWTFEKVFEDAQQYNSPVEWENNSGSAYNKALKEKWVDDCTKHMNPKQKKSGYWTKEKCLEDALKYKTREEWFNNNSYAYRAARKNLWIKDCTKHMPRIKVWTPETVFIEMKKYSTITSFMKKCSGGYKSIIRFGLLKECKLYFKNRSNDNDLLEFDFA